MNYQKYAKNLKNKQRKVVEDQNTAIVDFSQIDEIGELKRFPVIKTPFTARNMRGQMIKL